MASTAEPVDDSDPIKASYDVYIKPHLQDGPKLYILQFPNRASEQDYSAANSSLPSELRLKPKSGLVELDVPVDAWRNYDREKGAKWGEAMRRGNQGRGANGTGAGGTSYGLPGGFGIGGAQPTRARMNRQDEIDEEVLQEQIMRDYAGAVTNQRVLIKQTLGGQTVPKENTTPQYMIGVFRKSTFDISPFSLQAFMC
jgi:DNA-directed RNA polymerase-3 subunit RPC5